jgi:hypothetical protein
VTARAAVRGIRRIGPHPGAGALAIHAYRCWSAASSGRVLPLSFCVAALRSVGGASTGTRRTGHAHAIEADRRFACANGTGDDVKKRPRLAVNDDGDIGRWTRVLGRELVVRESVGAYRYIVVGIRDADVSACRGVYTGGAAVTSVGRCWRARIACPSISGSGGIIARVRTATSTTDSRERSGQGREAQVPGRGGPGRRRATRAKPCHCRPITLSAACASDAT